MSRIGCGRKVIVSLAAAWLAAIVIRPQTASAAEPTRPHAAEKDATPASPVSLAQFQQAAQIAKLAADHDMHDLSRRVMLKVLSSGPPLNLQVMSRLGQPKPRVSVGRGRAASANSPFKVESEVTQTLSSLAGEWKRGSPAEEVYQTLAAIVLPEHRPREIFLYDVPPAAPSPPVSRGGSVTSTALARPVAAVEWPVVAKLLVEAAVEAGRTDDLKHRIVARAGDAHAEFAAAILLVQLSMIDGLDMASVWPQLERLARHDPPVYAARLLRDVVAKIEGPELPEKMVDWLQAALAGDAAQKLRIADDQTWLKLLPAMARWQFANDHAELARRNLETYARLPIGADTATVGFDLRRTTRWLIVCLEYCRAGLLDDALDALAKHADAADGARDALVTVCWLKVRQLLLDQLDDAARYERLIAWTLPAGNRPAPRFVGGFVPHDHRPALFQTALSRSWPNDEFTNNFNLLISAAREAGRLEELREKLAANFADDDLEAVTLAAVLARETGRIEDVRPRIERCLAAQLSALTEPAPAGQQLSLAAYVLTRTCLRAQRLSDLGHSLATVWRRSGARVDPTFLAHLDFELAAAATRGFGIDPNAVLDPGLAHWHAVRSGMNWMTPCSAPQWWAEHDGHLRCLSGNGQSALVFGYPLVGSGELSVDLLTSNAWGEFHYGGVLIGTHGLQVSQSNNFPLLAIEKMITPAARVGGHPTVNRWTLQIEPGKNHILKNGKLVYEIPEPSSAMPWLALCAWSPAAAAFRRVSISGDWRIPREVRLVEGDRMVGWTGAFYDLRTAPQPGPRRSRAGYFRNGPPLPPTNVVNTSAPPNGGWSAKNGELLGARFQSAHSLRPQPTRLTYFRPLQNGEVLRYEFYYQPHSIVHPALDRLTFLLEPQGVRLHWMTDHSDTEAGDLPLGNVADEPAARRGPPSLPLNVGEWNHIALSLTDDEVSIELNGVLIFQRKLESTNDRLFSFFRYQDQTDARIRNVVLSGNWPEQIPREEELFSRRRTPADAERQAEAKLVDAEQFGHDGPGEGQVEEKNP